MTKSPACKLLHDTQTQDFTKESSKDADADVEERNSTLPFFFSLQASKLKQIAVPSKATVKDTDKIVLLRFTKNVAEVAQSFRSYVLPLLSCTKHGARDRLMSLVTKTESCQSSEFEESLSL